MKQYICNICVHFIFDPDCLERMFPGWTILGSAYGSSRGHAGVCEYYGRFMEPLSGESCPGFRPRGAGDGSAP